MAERGPVRLYAVVPKDEAGAFAATTRGLRFVVCGPLAAVVGQPGGAADPRAALRHDRIVGRALQACSSVVPFRLGVELQSEAELQRVLEVNERPLASYLARFRNRVEMGLKAKLAASTNGDPRALPFDLEPVRALAPHQQDRRESWRRASNGQVFEGCYLISRQTIEAFWSAVEELRRAAPQVPLLGSGPWGSYSFCDFALRSARGEPQLALGPQ